MTMELATLEKTQTRVWRNRVSFSLNCPWRIFCNTSKPWEVILKDILEQVCSRAIYLCSNISSQCSADWDMPPCSSKGAIVKTKSNKSIEYTKLISPSKDTKEYEIDYENTSAPWPPSTLSFLLWDSKLAHFNHFNRPICMVSYITCEDMYTGPRGFITQDLFLWSINVI